MVVSCFTCSGNKLFSLAAARSWFILLSAGLIISSFTAQRGDALLAQRWCWQQSWLWITCCVHRGTSLLLRSGRWAMRKRLVRGWHTAVHMTTGPKLARGRGTRHSESCSGGHPEINHGGQILFKKNWNLLVLSEGANFPWCCSWKLRKSRAFRSQLTVVKGQV